MPFAFTFSWEVAGQTQFHEVFSDLERRLTDFREPLREAADVIESEAAGQFAAGGQPHWPPLKPATLARKRRRFGHTQILVESGALRDTVTNRTAPGAIFHLTATELRRGTSLSVGTARAWNLGLIQQLGAPRAHIPARPFLRLLEAAQKRIHDIFADWLRRIGGGL